MLHGAETVVIEGSMASFITKTMILPAALTFQGNVATSVNAAKTVGVDSAAQFELLKTLTGLITDFQKQIAVLDKALHHHADGDAFAHAKNARDTIIPAMTELRKTGDKLESIVSDDLWPLPTYREMLFIK